jgi:hypothetical protein
MKTFIISLSMCVLSYSLSQSQTTVFQYDFEAYNVGDYIVQEASHPWATWSNLPGSAEDAPISNAQSHSPSKSVHISNASQDLILKLGNKTSGKYAIEFYYYIPNNYGAYFNIQHFEAPGIEWAIEVYFGNNGSGFSKVNSIDVPFTHLNNSWTKVEAVIDLDIDYAWLYINDVVVREWVFSMQANDPTGTKQLGAVNFYAGSMPGQNPQYYIDDVKYTMLVQGNLPPQISLNTTNILTDGSVNETITVSNLGDQNMSFVAYPVFPQSGTKKSLPIIEHTPQDNNKLMIGEPITKKVYTPLHKQKNEKANELSYVVGAIANGLGYQSTANNVKSAVKFDYNFVNQYIGRELVSVTIGINDLPSGTTKVQIYERGSFSTPGAGVLLAEKDITFTTPQTDVTVTLDNPIYIDGKDIWIGYICDAIGGTFPIGMDEGPRVPGVNWNSVGPGWSEVSLTIDNNLYIMGTLQGSSVYQWVSVSPTTGSITGGSSQNLTLQFNTTGMSPGTYHAQIVVGCNDQTQEYSEIDVTLDIASSINEFVDNSQIITYPNPTNEALHIIANEPMLKIDVFSINGNHIDTYKTHSNNTVIDTSHLSSGLYIVRITTESHITEKKITVK